MRRPLTILTLVFVTALLAGSPALAQPATVRVMVFDEGVLPPSGMSSPTVIPGTPVSLVEYDGRVLAEGLTDSSGLVTFTAPPGPYILRFGGLGVPPHLAICTPFRELPVWMIPGVQDLPVAGAWVGWYNYWSGMPLLFESMDLDPEKPGPQKAVVAAPGETLTAVLSWRELPTVNRPVWYVSLFGSWQPATPLANVETGVAGPDREEAHSATVTFHAPLRPGLYSVRLVQVLDFTWPVSFYTGEHFSSTLARDMGISIVGRRNCADSGEGTVTVEAQKLLMRDEEDRR